jgi:hypothetical protein
MMDITISVNVNCEPFTRHLVNGELNPDYMKGSTAEKTGGRGVGTIGTIIGYYLGNDRVTPRFKLINHSTQQPSDWYEKNCKIIHIPVAVS